MAESKQIADVWGQNTEFKMKDVTLESYQSDSATLETTLNEIDALELKLTPLRNTRDDVARKLNEINTRARSGMKGFFGPNSSQYEQVGGTRSSERKKPTRKVATGDTK